MHILNVTHLPSIYLYLQFKLEMSVKQLYFARDQYSLKNTDNLFLELMYTGILI